MDEEEEEDDDYDSEYVIPCDHELERSEKVL